MSAANSCRQSAAHPSRRRSRPDSACRSSARWRAYRGSNRTGCRTAPARRFPQRCNPRPGNRRWPGTGPVAHPEPTAIGSGNHFAVPRARRNGDRRRLAKVRRLLRNTLGIKSLRRQLEHAGPCRSLHRVWLNPSITFRRARAAKIRNRNHLELGGFVDVPGEDRALLGVDHHQSKTPNERRAASTAAPSAKPTSWASDAGVHRNVDAE